MASVQVTRSAAPAPYQLLRSLGVTGLFGIDSPEPLYAELEEAIRPITMRDERSGELATRDH